MRLEFIIGSIVAVALGIGSVLVFLNSRDLGDVAAPLEIETADALAMDVAPIEVGSVPTQVPATSPQPSEAAKKARQFKRSPELVSPDGYINTKGEPITIGEFRGKKVVLIDIWTYSCINCERTLPYLKDWYSKYSDKGLEIIGVHTPEFAFEKLLKNVQSAVDEDGIKYPVILDNAYKTWNAFGNQYWPRKYLIDIDGYIVFDHAGEGAYAETERAIQKALAERAERLGLSIDTNMPISQKGGLSESDLRRVQSPETYFGAERNDRFGNGLLWSEGEQTLAIPSTLKQNAFYLSGTWNIHPEYATNKTAGAYIKYIYNARSVYFVASAETAIKIKVTRDGKPLGDARGEDVNGSGEVVIQKNGLYKLVEDADYGMHTLEIFIENPGLQAYTFTFG